MNITLLGRQRGFTLVEIMVALVISLFLLAGLIQILTSSRQVYRVQDGLARIQENGRFGMDFITKSVREAGYPAISDKPSVNYGKFDGTAIRGEEGTSGAPDTITLSFDASTDCLGNDTLTVSVPGGSVGRTVNRFFLENNSLKCKTFNPTDYPSTLTLRQTQPLIDNVEDMQILYGIDRSGDQAANQYVNAKAVNDNNDWNNVVSVRVCLLVRSVEDNLVNEKLSYQDCNGNSKTPTDRFVRRIFISTINLRNRINVSPAFWN